MKYFVKVLPSLFKILGVITAICVAVYVILGVDTGNYTSHLLVIVIIWLVLCLALSGLILSKCISSAGYLNVFCEKGYCQEYIDAFKKANIDNKSIPSDNNLLTLASAYLALERYDDAEQIFSKINVNKPNTNDIVRHMYYNDYVSFLLQKYRTEEAEAVYNYANQSMQVFIQRQKEYQKVWNDNYLMLLMQQGKYDEAISYYNQNLLPDSVEDKFAVFSLITLVVGAVLNGRNEDAERFKQQATEYINRLAKVDYSWQKQYYLDKLTSNINSAENYVSNKT